MNAGAVIHIKYLLYHSGNDVFKLAERCLYLGCVSDTCHCAVGLSAALAACYIRNGRSELETPYFESSPTSSEKVLPLLARGKKTKKEKRAENDGQSKENGKK